MDEITTTPAPEETRAADEAPRRDPTARRAALWASLVALPVTIAVAAFTFAKLSPDVPEAAPSPSPSAARPQSTAPVAMPAPALAERSATVCRALVSQLPASVRELNQRPVTAGPEQNAAYGDPALIVACGVPAPSFPPTDDVWVVNGVCWHPEQRPDAVVLTTVDREVPVQMAVPRAYGQPLQWIPPVADPVVEAVPSAASAPSGCRRG